MPTLTRYLGRIFLARLAVVLLATAALALLLDLLEAGPDVIAREASPFALARYAGLRLPVIGADLLPVGALLAGILSAADLLRHRELVAIWNLGTSPFQLMRHLLPLGLLLIAAQYLLDDLAAPRAIAELRVWGVGEGAARGPEQRRDGVLWLRSGADVVRLSAAAAARGRLADLTVFRRDAAGRLIERLDAPVARPQVGAWMLEDVIRRPVATVRSDPRARLLWHTRLDLARVVLLGEDPRALSLGQLWQIVASDGFGIAPIERQATWLHARLAGVFLPFAMALLPLGLARFRRAGESAPIVGFGLAIGFAYFVAESVMSSAATAGWLTPWVAAWTPLLGLGGLVLALALLGGAPFGRRTWSTLLARAPRQRTERRPVDLPA